MTLTEKLNLKLNRLKNPVTRNNKKSILNKFFEVVGYKDTYDEYDAMKFLEWAEKYYHGSSISQVYQVVKWFYNKFGFDFNDIPTSEIKYEEMTNEPIKKEDMIKLIQARNEYDPYIAGLVALSTTYGTRAKEMKDLQFNDIDLDNKKIFIRTAKSGRDTWRWMLIPDEIIDVLKIFKILTNQERKTTYIFSTFHKACHIAGITGLPKRSGWHMIRRRIIIDLTKTGLSDNVIVRFMRWKRKDAMTNILYRYRSTEPDEELFEEVDKKVFEVHPFLEYWV